MDDEAYGDEDGDGEGDIDEEEGMDSSDEDGHYGDELDHLVPGANHYASNSHITPD